MGPSGPLHIRFQKGQSDNPDARSAKCLLVPFDLMKLVLARFSLVASKPVGSVPWVGDVGGCFSLADA
jgi:hypothetical protein